MSKGKVELLEERVAELESELDAVRRDRAIPPPSDKLVYGGVPLSGATIGTCDAAPPVAPAFLALCDRYAAVMREALESADPEAEKAALAELQTKVTLTNQALLGRGTELKSYGDIVSAHYDAKTHSLHAPHLFKREG